MPLEASTFGGRGNGFASAKTSLFSVDSGGIIIIIIIIIIHLYSAFSTRFKGAVYKSETKLKSKNNHKKLTLKTTR